MLDCRSRAAYAISLAGAYAAIYLVALVVLWTIGNNDPIHTRFTAPLYAYLVLFGFVLFTAISPSHRPGWPEAALLAVGPLIATPNATSPAKLLRSFPGAELIEIRFAPEAGHHWHRSVTRSGEIRPEPATNTDGMLYRPRQ